MGRDGVSGGREEVDEEEGVDEEWKERGRIKPTERREFIEMHQIGSIFS